MLKKSLSGNVIRDSKSFYFLFLSFFARSLAVPGFESQSLLQRLVGEGRD